MTTDSEGASAQGAPVEEAQAEGVQAAGAGPDAAVPVLAPLAGTVVALAEIPDPVFAQGMVGGGIGLRPEEEAHGLTVTSPVAGTVVKAHPHAQVIRHASGAAVLVHVGLDTVGLGGRGFDVVTAEGKTVSAGDPLVVVDLDVVRAAGLDPICPVVVLDTAPEAVVSPVLGQTVRAGEPVLVLPGAVQ